MTKQEHPFDELMLHHLSYKLHKLERSSFLTSRLNKAAKEKSKYKLSTNRFSVREVSFLQSIYPGFLAAYTLYFYIAEANQEKNKHETPYEFLLDLDNE